MEHKKHSTVVTSPYYKAWVLLCELCLDYKPNEMIGVPTILNPLVRRYGGTIPPIHGGVSWSYLHGIVVSRWSLDRFTADLIAYLDELPSPEAAGWLYKLATTKSMSRDLRQKLLDDDWL